MARYLEWAGSGAGLAEVGSRINLSGARSYLAHMRSADFTLEAGSTKWLEDGIVAASRSSGTQTDEKLLHVWLTVCLARADHMTDRTGSLR